MDYRVTIQSYIEGEFEIEELKSSDVGKISPDSTDSLTSEEWLRCGEIFVENPQRFVLVCCLCKMQFNEMKSFGEHIASMHWPFDKFETMFLDEYAESQSSKNEVFEGRAECVESNGGISDEVLEELEFIDECQAASSSKVDNPKQTNVEKNNDELKVKDVKMLEEFWIQSDVKSEEMNEENSDYMAELASGLSAKMEPENSIIKSVDSVEEEVDCEDRMSDDFSDLYEQISQDIEEGKKKSVLVAKEDPKYFCAKCNLQCTDRSYSLHMRVHHDVLSKRMKAKLKRGESIPPWKCEVCGKIFLKKDGFAYHMTTHTGEKPHQCPHCPRAFASKGNLSVHVRIHLGIKEHKCSFCEKRFVSSTGRVLHERSHTQVYPFQCEKCGKRFRHVHNLRDHATEHTDITYDCSRCDKKFKRRGQLRRHEPTHRKLNLSCEICKRTLSSHRNLRIHMDIHSAENKYVCSCGKAYSKYSRLYWHRRTHSQEVKSGNS